MKALRTLCLDPESRGLEALGGDLGGRWREKAFEAWRQKTGQYFARL